MSLGSKRNLLTRIRKGREARRALVANNLAESIAFQIAATRDKRGWSQARLAELAGMTQNNISRLESPDYGKHTLTSLRKIADALDVALVVWLLPFSQYVDWLSGTPRIDQGLRAEFLAVDSFEDEQTRSKFSVNVHFSGISISQNIPANTSIFAIPAPPLAPDVGQVALHAARLTPPYQPEISGISA